MNSENNKSGWTALLNILGHIAAGFILTALLVFMNYLYLLSNYGSVGTTYTYIFGVKVIYPIPGEPDCEVREMTAELVEVKTPGFLGGSSSHYYLKFSSENVEDRAFEIRSLDVVYYNPDDTYNVTICDGVIISYKDE